MMASTSMLRVFLQQGKRHALTSSFMTYGCRAMSSALPYHIVVGMPALSPTMEQGTLSAWKVEEGQSFAAGDSLAEIETDKASIDFEAQDDGFVAKFLVKPGIEIKVGEPIMITVEEEDQIGAFKDFTLDDIEGGDTPSVAEEAKVESPDPVAPTATAAKVETAPVSTPVVASTPTPVPTPVQEMNVVSAVQAPTGNTSSIAWDPQRKTKSPIAKSLAAAQQAYHEIYGPTGHKPIE